MFRKICGPWWQPDSLPRFWDSLQTFATSQSLSSPATRTSCLLQKVVRSWVVLRASPVFFVAKQRTSLQSSRVLETPTGDEDSNRNLSIFEFFNNFRGRRRKRLKKKKKRKKQKDESAAGRCCCGEPRSSTMRIFFRSSVNY